MKISQLSMMSLGLMVALSACSVESTMDPITAIPLPPPQSPSAPESSKVKVDGSWKLDCVAQDGYYQIETMKFENGKIETTVSLYYNSGCTGSPIFNQTVKGNYTLGAASAAVTGATEVDATLQDPQTGELRKYFLVVLVEGTKMFLPPTTHDSSKTRATSIDRSKPYVKIGG
ncbi:MAG: hypothetical protein V4760_06170 [Bdellovibrionota bacterium]